MFSRSFLIVLLQCAMLAGCAVQSGKSPEPTAQRKAELQPGQYEVFGKVYEVMDDNLGYLEIGIASWYGRKFHGRLTAMGEVYDMYAMTAAHKALPLPTVVKVTNLDNGRSVRLRVNDRGPFHDDRLIDLSYGAARELGFQDRGIAPVVVEAIDEINHPELVRANDGQTNDGQVNDSQTEGRQTEDRPTKDGSTWYLQVGAFGRLDGAEKRLREVRDALPVHVQSRILISETRNGILHKVWVGPMDDLEEERQIEQRILDRNLGKPLKVEVE